MPDVLRLSSFVRALGATKAAALPPGLCGRLGLRAAALALTDALAHRIDPRGISIVNITPDKGETFTPGKQLACDAFGTAQWTGLGLLLVAGPDGGGRGLG